MALKRKSDRDSEKDKPKKPKLDFFAPRLKQNPSSDAFAYNPPAKTFTRIVAWNVNGIMSVNEKILNKYLEAEDPSILILTETKSSKGKPDIMCLKTRFKHQYWGVDPRPGYGSIAGTAVLSKHKPLKAAMGLPEWEESSGRYVELEFDHIFVVGTYVPNSGDQFKAMELKKKWNFALMKRLRELETIKPVIWGGDFNCIMSKQDLDTTAQGFWNQMSGLSQWERDDMEELLRPKDSQYPRFCDVWRHLHPTDEQFTHWTTKFGAWRLDSFILSGRLLQNVGSCEIRHELKDLNLSDHWPVSLDIDTDTSLGSGTLTAEEN